MLTQISAVRSFRRICTDRLDLLVVPARSTAQIGPKAHADACLLQYYCLLWFSNITFVPLVTRAWCNSALSATSP